MNIKIYSIAAVCAAALALVGCGNVDMPLEKKNVSTTTATSFTFITTTTETSTTTTSASSTVTSKATTTAIPVTTTKKITTTIPVTTTPATTTTTHAPTTTTTTTTPAPTTTTTTPPPTETTTTTTPVTTTPTTTESTTTISYADPNNPDINNMNLDVTANVNYNGIELGVGDSFASIQELLGEELSPPTSVVSRLSNKDVIVYHYHNMELEVDDDTISGIEITGAPSEDGENEPQLCTGVKLGSGIDSVFASYGNGQPINDDTLMYCDGYIKLAVSLPGNIVSDIQITFL